MIKKGKKPFLAKKFLFSGGEKPGGWGETFFGGKGPEKNKEKSGSAVFATQLR